MLKEFQTISIDGIEASVVHVHNDHAYEIEYHDERERRVVTLDLDPDQTEREKMSHSRSRVLMPPCTACGCKAGEAISVGAGALAPVCAHCVDEMADIVAEARDHVLDQLRSMMIEQGIPVEGLEWVKDGKRRRLHVTSPAVHQRGSAAVLEALRPIVDGRNGLPIQVDDIVVVPSAV